MTLLKIQWTQKKNAILNFILNTTSIIKFNFLLCFLTTIQISGFSLNETINNSDVFLLSYPRSGNTWLRYCIEYLTKRPTGVYEYLYPIESRLTLPQNTELYVNYPLGCNFNLGVDFRKHPIIKIHDKSGLSANAKFLILVIRNYKECLVRHLRSNVAPFKYLKSENDYISNIQLFDNWKDENKLLLYYEDLIQKPEITLKKLIEFLNESDLYLTSFFENHLYHVKNCIKIYERDVQTIYSKNEHIFYHSKNLSQEMKHTLDALCKANDPYIFEKYLKRYEEN